MNVLFVCAGNSFRSPVAAALLKHLLTTANLAAGYSVDSAGLEVHEDPDSAAREHALSSRGIEVHTHAPKPLTRAEIEWADQILCFDQAHLTRLIEDFQPRATPKLLAVVNDPYLSGDYQSAAGHIELALVEWVSNQP